MLANTSSAYIVESINNGDLLVYTGIKTHYYRKPRRNSTVEVGWYKLKVRQEKTKYLKDGKVEYRQVRLFEINIPACELEGMLKMAKLASADVTQELL